jgi:hypothetical protein
LKPWQQRSWIFPRHPDFPAKAGRVLDLYTAPISAFEEHYRHIAQPFEWTFTRA